MKVVGEEKTGTEGVNRVLHYGRDKDDDKA